MKKKDASFWSDIKTLDERLKKDPDSFCFARLSEIYLKVGLVADALHTARAGAARHPGYLAGQRALGMACNASGLHDEARAILEYVTAAIPEDVDAQKVLASLYVTSGNLDSAIRAYATVLEFRPEDKVASTELESLRQSGGTYPPVSRSAVIPVPPVFAQSSADEEEDIIELSENDVYEEQLEEITAEPPSFGSGLVGTSDRNDPLSTLTLAELYEKQGFISKALDIYRTILADDPANAQLKDKIAILEGGDTGPESDLEDEVPADFEDESERSEPTAIDDASDAMEEEIAPSVAEFGLEDFAAEASAPELVESSPEFSVDAFEPEAAAEPVETASDFEARSFEPEAVTTDATLVESFDASAFETPAPIAFQEIEPAIEEPVDAFVSEIPALETAEMTLGTVEPAAFAPLANKSADNVLETLDNWLENIRRIKACR